MGTDYNPASARHRLVQSEIVIRVTKHKFGLREWGLDEYTGVSDEIAQEIEACGGVTTLDHLIDVLPSRYEVAEASIRMCAATPRFVLNSRGELRLRRESDPRVRARGSLDRTPRCYRHEGGWVIRLPVDTDLLRGSGRSCPGAFAAKLGVHAGGGRAFPFRETSITVSWHERSTSGPSFGSLREVTRQLGGEAGDWLFIQESGHQLDAWITTKREVEKRSGVGRALLLAGFQSLTGGGGQEALARAVSLGEGASFRRIAAKLRDRSEGDLADLLPTTQESDKTVEGALSGARNLFEP